MYQSVRNIFGLNEVYEEQVKNAEDGNFASWSENVSYGYWSGGGFDAGPTGNTVYSIISRLDYSTQTHSSLSASLPGNRRAPGSASDRQYGYIAGGDDASLLHSNISRLDFSNETVSNPGKVLSEIRHHVKGVSTFNYGYFAGGYTPVSGSVSTINRMEFSNETVSSPGKNLIADRNIMPGPIYTKSFGYFCGGYSNGLFITYSNISRLDYSSETVSNPGTNLTAARNNSGAVSGKNFGYFFGGQSTAAGGTIESTVIRFDFSTETCNNLPNLASRYTQSSGTSDFNHGYVGGRTVGTPTGDLFSWNNSVERIDYTTEVRSSAGTLPGSSRPNNSALSGTYQERL